MEITMAELRRLAEQHGHSNLSVSESRRGWRASCACGYESARLPSQEIAEQQCADHFMRVAQAIHRRLRASGRIAG